MVKSSVSVSLRGRPLKEQLILFFAFGCGFGFIRPAPGTWGTLPGVAIAWAVMSYPWIHFGILIAVCVIGVWLCDKASEILGVHDHGGIVIDEIAGVLLTLWLFEPTMLVLAIGFVWFRVFDIIKPPPIAWVDRHVNNGFGILIDDIIAGAFAWPCLWLTLYIINSV